MSKEKNSVEKEEQPIKDNKRKKIVFGIVFVFVILFIILLILMLNDTKKEKGKDSNSNTNTNVNVDNHFNYDYKYVLQTFFGADYFIYLLNDGSVKVVGKIPRAEVCQGTNCMEFTGEFDYEETTIEFSDKSMDKVRDFITSFFDKKLTNYVNLEKLELSREQQRMELAILLNSEDDITFEDDLNYQTTTKQLKNSAGKVIFENEKTTIVESDNKIVQAIGNYLNAIVEKEWQTLNDECLELIKNGVPSNELLGIKYALKLEDIGVYSYSFVYSTSGSLGGVPWTDYKGYVFSSNGELKEFPNGWKDKVFTEVLNTFKKSDEYKDMKEDLKGNWENELKENMFNSGYWYFKGDKIIFTFPKTLISEYGPSFAMVKIEIENIVGDF